MLHADPAPTPETEPSSPHTPVLHQEAGVLELYSPCKLVLVA